MADNVTVDELSIRITANATAAAESIRDLTTALASMVAVLQPAQISLSKVTELLKASKGAAPALKAALTQTAASTKAMGESVAESTTSLEALQTRYNAIQKAFRGGDLSGAGAMRRYGSIIADTRSELDRMALAGDEAYNPAQEAALNNLLSQTILEAESIKKLTKLSGTTSPIVSPAVANYSSSMNQMNRMMGGFTPGGDVATAQIAQYDKQLKVVKTSLNQVRKEVGTTVSYTMFDDMLRDVQAVELELTKLKASQNAMTGAMEQTTKKGIWPLGKAFGISRDNAKGAGAATTMLDKVVNKLANRGGSSIKSLTSHFINLRSAVFFTMFVASTVGVAFAGLIKSAMDYYEQMHLFGAVMGANADAANRYADGISNALGIDPAAFKKTYATFYEMAQAMNMSSESADTMSRNFTQLTYDYASLFDMDFNTVFERFRSAMAGQTRAIHQFGLDVTQAALQEELYAEGFNYPISQLNKANKAILMHNAILRNSKTAQGDLARTITQPANMVRVLKDQFIILARTVGFLFMPVLQALLPWLITLTITLTNAAKAFLGLFGIMMPSWSGFTKQISGAGAGTDDLYGNMEGVEDATGGAAKAAKELRDYVMGIDELNIIKPETDTGGGGAGAGAGGADLGLKPFNVYDMLGGIDALKKITEPVIAKFKEFAAAIEPFLDAVERLWEALKPFAANVWDGFKSFYTDTLLPLATWTLNTAGVAALDSLTKVLDWFNKNPETAESLGKVLGFFGLFKGLDAAMGGLKKVGSILKWFLEFNSLNAIFAALSDIIVLFTSGDITTKFGLFIAEALAGEGVLATLATGFQTLVTWVSAAGSAISGIFTTLAGLSAGAVALIVAAVAVTIAQFAAVAEFFKRNWYSIKDTIEKVVTTIWNIISKIFEMISALIQVAMAYIKAVIMAVWNALPAEVQQKLISMFDTIKRLWSDFKEFIKIIIGGIGTIISGMWDGMINGFSRAWYNVKSVIIGILNVMVDIINFFIDRVNALIKSANELPGGNKIGSIARLVPITMSSNEPTSRPIGGKFAAGGMPAYGQMFIAGEAGAELIGSFGGNSNTVMPLENSGFVEAMAAAVYSATAAALKTNTQGGGVGNVYIDGVKAGQIINTSTTRAGASGSLISVGMVK